MATFAQGIRTSVKTFEINYGAIPTGAIDFYTVPANRAAYVLSSSVPNNGTISKNTRNVNSSGDIVFTNTAFAQIVDTGALLTVDPADTTPHKDRSMKAGDKLTYDIAFTSTPNKKILVTVVEYF